MTDQDKTALLSKLRAEGVQAGDERDAARYRVLRSHIAPLRLAESMGIPRKQVKRSDDPAARVDEMCDAALASAPVAKPSPASEDFAQEVWAAAQSPHGEPVEKSVARVASLLAEASAPVADENPDESNPPVPLAGHSMGPLAPIYDHVGSLIGQALATARHGAYEGSIVWARVRKAGEWMPWQVAGRQSAPVAGEALTAEDVERQYRDGVHIGSGLPRATCPCGFCSKHRRGFERGDDLAAPQASEAVRAHNDAIKAAAKVCTDIARQYDPQNNQEHALASELYSAALAIRKLEKDGGDCAKGAGDEELPWLRAYMHHQIASDRWVVTADQARAFAKAAVIADREQRSALSAQPGAQKEQSK